MDIIKESNAPEMNNNLNKYLIFNNTVFMFFNKLLYTFANIRIDFNEYKC